MKQLPVRYISTGRKEPEMAGNFSIRSISSVLAGEAMVQPLHRHDFYYILAIASGTGTHEIDFVPYPVEGGSIFIMRPGQVHRLNLDSATEGYIMQFGIGFYAPREKAAAQSFSKAAAINRHKPETQRFGKLLAILENILAEYTAAEENYPDAIRAALALLFIGLARGLETQHTQDVMHRQELIEKFIAYLETNIHSHKKVSDYAGMLNVSLYQLNSATKAALGKTASDLINAQVILEAKRCLLATTRQVNQIAYRLGYDDVSYFIRFFRQQTGHTPEAFRQNFT